MIHLENIVCLGLAVPEQISDGRKTVCMAAYHQDIGLIRIYPCRADMGLCRWQRFSAYVERNPLDSRYESFKLVGSHDQWDSLSVVSSGKLPRQDRITLLEKVKTTCVTDINTARFSLGIIKPREILSVWFELNPSYSKPKQNGLSYKETDQWVTTKSDYPFHPRVIYRCSDACKGHNQTILEWGAYEWIRKNPGDEYQVLDNWRLTDSEYEHFLLVGNQCHQRTSFLVINLIPFRTLKSDSPSLKQVELFA